MDNDCKKGEIVMLSILKRFFERKKVIQQVPIPVTLLNISEFNNVWNQLACELARPDLNMFDRPDEKKVKRLKARLIELKRERDGGPKQLELQF